MLQYLSCHRSSALSMTLAAKFLIISCYNILSAKGGAELTGWWASNAAVKYLWMQKHIESPSRESLFHRFSSCLIMLHRFHRYPAPCSMPSCDWFSFKVLPSWKLSTKACIFVWVPILAEAIKEHQRTMDHGLPAWPNVHHCLRCSKASSRNWTLATCEDFFGHRFGERYTLWQLPPILHKRAADD